MYPAEYETCAECESKKDLHDIACDDFPGYEDLDGRVTLCWECLTYEGHPPYKTAERELVKTLLAGGSVEITEVNNFKLLFDEYLRQTGPVASAAEYNSRQDPDDGLDDAPEPVYVNDPDWRKVETVHGEMITHCEICGEPLNDEIGEFAVPAADDGSPCWQCGAARDAHAPWCNVPSGEGGTQSVIAHAQCGLDAGYQIA
jgi:hypothetical protein